MKESNYLGIADELIKLKKLLDDGILSKDEFNQIKHRLLELKQVPSFPEKTKPLEDTEIFQLTESERIKFESFLRIVKSGEIIVLHRIKREIEIMPVKYYDQWVEYYGKNSLVILHPIQSEIQTIEEYELTSAEKTSEKSNSVLQKEKVTFRKPKAVFAIIVILILICVGIPTIYLISSKQTIQKSNPSQSYDYKVETCEKAKEIVVNRASILGVGVDMIECQEITNNIFNIWGAGWMKQSGDRISFSASVTKEGEIHFSLE